MSIHDRDDAAALLAVVARQKRRARGPRRAASLPAADGPEPEMPDTLFDDAIEAVPPPASAPEPAKRKPKAKAPRRIPLTDDGIALGARLAPTSGDTPSGPGLVTLGVVAGLDGLRFARAGGRRLGLWGIAAAAAVIMTVTLGAYSGRNAPAPLPVSGVRVTWLPGPQLPAREVLALLRGFPGRTRLNDPDQATLTELAAFLRAQPLIGEARQVRLTHETAAAGQPLRRILELVVALRVPAMPAMLATGERAWVDAQGYVLPGILPAPDGPPRPLLRGIESGGQPALKAALDLWSRLEPALEPGLITDICLNDPLDLKDQRGLVLYTRQGSRVIWGRPEDERYGVEREQKVRDLVHTIRCQGDLGRIATINVRFRQPFFVLR